MARVVLAPALALACLLSGGGAPACAAQAPDASQAALQRCIERLEAGTRVTGFAQIAQRCRDLPEALAHSRWEAALPADWRRGDNDLTRAGLIELQALLVQQSTPLPSGTGGAQPVLPARALAAQLHGLGIGDADISGWRERLLRWARAFGAQRDAERAPDLLAPLWQRLDFFATPWSVVAVIAVAATLGCAAWLLVAELRASGLRLLPPERPAREPRPDSDARQRRARRPPSQLVNFALADRPATLLRLLEPALPLAPPAAAVATLTIGELIDRARLAPDEAGRLRALARLAEELRFAAHVPPAARIEAGLADGLALLAVLERSGPSLAAATAAAAARRMST